GRPAGRQRDALFPGPLGVAPAAAVGHERAAGDVDVIDLDVEGAVGEPAGDSQRDVVFGAAGHVDGIGEPLPGLDVVHDVAAAFGIGGGDDVHVLVGPVLPSGVARNVIVVADAFAAAIEILRLEEDRRRGDDSDRVEVEVLLVHDDFEDMPAGGQRHALFADPLEVAPAAGVGHEHAAGDVDAIDFDVEGAVGEPAGDSQRDVVLGAAGHVDGIGEPLPGLEVVHDIAAACGVGGDDDVDVFARPVLASGIAFDVVVVGDAFAAAIEILRLERRR